MKFLEELKKELRPKEDVLKKVDAFIEELNRKVDVRIVAGGSVAKGTFLKGDFDVDLFALFPYEKKDDDLSDQLEQMLSAYKPERLHGSRDYFQIEHKGLGYEIVPVLDIKDPLKAENVTDMSPLHVDWVKDHLKKGQADEIRLAKKFCKAQRVYGAESYISGFSGHVIDILIIHYGSFVELLQASSTWKAKVVIDVEHYFEHRRDVLFDINQSKLQGPMVVVDPLMKERNAASALNYKQFSRFKKKAQAFLKDPSRAFFEEKKIGKTYLKSKYDDVHILSIEAPKGKRDVVGSKILKAYQFLKRKLKKRGFAIKDSGWSWNKKRHALMWFVFADNMLPEQKIITGPPTDLEEHVEAFMKKYDDVFNRDGKLYAEVKVEKRKAIDNIKELCRDEYFGERVSLKDVEHHTSRR